MALLGPLTVTQNGSSLELSGPKRRALLILLALNAGTPVSRDRIVEALWPKRQTGREESSLRVHISHLRTVLEPLRDGPPRVLVTRGSAYMLSREIVDLDIDRFEQLTKEGRALLPTQPDAARQLLSEALGLWRGRPLQDVEYEEFAQEAIRRLELARIEAIENRAEALVELGENAAAIEDLEALVRTDPTRERPVRLLMRALYRTGRQADSLRVARRHARHLAERGLEPSPQVNLLEDRILQHDQALLPEGMVSPSDIKPGRSVRGYELREEAGAGSIGIVFRAFQSSVGRQVALKVIHPRLAQAPEFVRRFAEEARVIAGLEHPHIVPLFDFWREPAGAFLVMRWMDGGSLGERIGRSWKHDDLGRVFGQLAEALGYAHSAGVVHRDVKPANVLFDSSANAYLCDFGLAVTGIDTGFEGKGRSATIEPPYASPEVLRGEGPTVTSDVFGLGVLLAEAASGSQYRGVDTPLGDEIREVVLVATAANPADRYPDMLAFRSALQDAIGTTTIAAPRRVRRNPYKGLAPFDEGDSADFYGRDDVIETLIDVVGAHGLMAIIGASGSGKSSVVMAGLVPSLRDGALPGSDEWSIVQMVPGTDPFDEFHIGLRSAAVGYAGTTPGDRSRELRDGFAAALEGPNSRALLIVDQFEELFSFQVDEVARQLFLDNLVDLAVDPSRRIRVVLTLRADFSDRPLAHPRFGDLMARASVLLAPMRPEQVEDVIRRPAARVGVQVEPGLIAEIVRDVARAPAYLPLLQYVLSELFERRNEDRLTVQAYRALGGVQGVLERRAEATFSSLGSGAQQACRQLFLRMVHLGDHGEETRRRVPLTELHGLGRRAEVEQALEAFSTVRLLTYDRDPITRTPTVEVAHETVIGQWTRYRIWIDEARADLLAHRRLSAAAATWAEADEDPSYLLTSGPLAAALDVASGDRIDLNALEARFVAKSRHADEAARELEAERRRQEAVLEHRARRRLAGGIATAVIAAVIALVAAFAWVERQRANDLAAAQERQNLARELAAASIASLTSADPDLSLLLALAGADQSTAAGEEILPEVVDALHRSVINPRPDLIISGAGNAFGGQVVEYSSDGSRLVILTSDGGAVVVDPRNGEELGRIRAIAPAAFGVDFHPDGNSVLTAHPDGVRQWDWQPGDLELELTHQELGLPDGSAVTVAIYSPDGSRIAVGGTDGVIRIWSTTSSDLVTRLEGHEATVLSIDFDPSGSRIASSGLDNALLFWDTSTAQVTARGNTALLITSVKHLAWNPVGSAVAATTHHGEMLLIDTETGERLNSFGNGGYQSHAVAFDSTGSFMIAAGADGVARLFGTWVGGETGISLPSGGVPLRDAAINPSKPLNLEVATVGVDGNVRIWGDLLRSELPAISTRYLAPQVIAPRDGRTFALVGRAFWLVTPDEQVPRLEVIDANTFEVIRSWPALGSLAAPSPSMTPDGSIVAFAGATGDLEIVDVESGETTRLPELADLRRGHPALWIASIALSSNGSLLAAAGYSGTIAVWEVSSGELVATLSGHGDRAPIYASEPDATGRVDEVLFRPGSAELASVGYDGTVRVWDLTTGDGRVLHTFDYEVFSLAFSTDGSLIAAADRTGTVQILDADTGEVLRTPDPVSGPPNLAFSPDGRLLAAAGPGPIVHLWDVETGRIRRRLEGSVYWPTSVAFLNGGTELLVASTEGIQRRYVLDPLELVEIARAEVTRELTEDECQRYLQRSCDE